MTKICWVIKKCAQIPYTSVGFFVTVRRMNVQCNMRVYYEDTDAGGRVYYANYLNYAERARTEFLRARGIEQSPLLRDFGIAFVVRRCEVDYLRPAMLDDLLTIETRLHDITRARIEMQQWIRCGEALLVEMQVKLAVIRAETGAVARMPEQLLSIFKK